MTQTPKFIYRFVTSINLVVLCKILFKIIEKIFIFIIVSVSMFSRLPNIDLEPPKQKEYQLPNSASLPATNNTKQMHFDPDVINKFTSSPLISKSMVVLPRYATTKQQLIDELLQIPYKGVVFEKQSTCVDKISEYSYQFQSGPEYCLLDDFLQTTKFKRSSKQQTTNIHNNKNTSDVEQRTQRRINKVDVLDYFMKQQPSQCSSDVISQGQKQRRSEISKSSPLKYNQLIHTKTMKNSNYSRHKQKDEHQRNIISKNFMKKKQPKVEHQNQSIQTSVLNCTSKSIQCSIIKKEDQSAQYQYSRPDSSLDISYKVKDSDKDEGESQSQNQSFKNIQSSIQEKKSIDSYHSKNKNKIQQKQKKQQYQQKQQKQEKHKKQASISHKQTKSQAQIIQNKKQASTDAKVVQKQIPIISSKKKIIPFQFSADRSQKSYTSEVQKNDTNKQLKHEDNKEIMKSIELRPSPIKNQSQINGSYQEEESDIIQNYKQKTIQQSQKQKIEDLFRDDHKSNQIKKQQLSKQQDLSNNEIVTKEKNKQSQRSSSQSQPVRKSVDLIEEKKKRDRLLKLQEQTNKKLFKIFDLPNPNSISQNQSPPNSKITDIAPSKSSYVQKNTQQRQKPADQSSKNFMKSKDNSMTVSKMDSFHSKNTSKRAFQDFVDFSDPSSDLFDEQNPTSLDSFDNYQSSSQSYDRNKYVLEQVQQDYENQESLANSKMKIADKKQSKNQQFAKNIKPIQNPSRISEQKSQNAQESIVQQYSIGSDSRKKDQQSYKNSFVEKNPKVQTISNFSQQKPEDNSFNLQQFIIKDIKSNVDELKQKMSSQVSGSDNSVINAFQDFNKQIKYQDFKNDIQQLKKKIVTSTNL